MSAKMYLSANYNYLFYSDSGIRQAQKVFVKKPFNSVSELNLDSNKSLASGCATLGIPASLYLASQKKQCIFKRKKPGLSQQKQLETKEEYAARRAKYIEELESWEAQSVYRRWVIKQRMSYDDLKDKSLSMNQLNENVQVWYDGCSRLQQVAPEYVAGICARLEHLHATGNSRSTQSKNVKERNAEKGVRDLFGHLDVLKKRLPSYKRQCANLVSARDDSATNTGLGEDLDSLFDQFYCVEDIDGDTNGRITLFKNSEPPEILKAKMRK